MIRYLDADFLAKQCYKKAEIAKEEAEIARKDQIYKKAKRLQSANGFYVTADLKKAVKEYASIPGWKDADEQLAACKERIRQIEEEEARKMEADRLQREKEAKKKKQIAIIAVAVAVAIIAALVVWFQVIIPNKHYNEAVALMDAGKTVEAYEALIALDGYKDSAEKAKELHEQYPLECCAIGDYITFGTYEQDNNTANGKEEIEWLVLDKKDGKALVISKYALDCQQYNTEYTDVTWETCSLRKWMNGTFLNEAFSEAEKPIIPTVTVSADKNPEYSTNPGNATQDKVFLLSITEANQYFSSDSTRQCEATAYAEAQGAYVNSSNGNCWWWLRSPGYSQSLAAYVLNYGDVNEFGNYVYSSNSAVRPALWIDLES